jgi:hypothetical protein
LTFDLFAQLPRAVNIRTACRPTFRQRLRIHALHIRQSEVQNDSIKILGAAELIAKRTSGSVFHDEARLSQPFRQASRKFWIVLYQQDSNGTLPYPYDQCTPS